VDEDVDAAESDHCGLSHRLHRRGIGDVAVKGHRLAAAGFDLVRNGFGLRAIATRIHQHGGTALRQRQRDGTADVASPAGDNRDLARKFPGHESGPRGVERSMPMTRLRQTWNILEYRALIASLSLSTAAASSFMVLMSFNCLRPGLS